MHPAREHLLELDGAEGERVENRLERSIWALFERARILRADGRRLLSQLGKNREQINSRDASNTRVARPPDPSRPTTRIS
jgi:hypothetical protein